MSLIFVGFFDKKQLSGTSDDNSMIPFFDRDIHVGSQGFPIDPKDAKRNTATAIVEFHGFLRNMQFLSHGKPGGVGSGLKNGDAQAQGAVEEEVLDVGGFDIAVANKLTVHVAALCCGEHRCRLLDHQHCCGSQNAQYHSCYEPLAIHDNISTRG